MAIVVNEIDRFLEDNPAPIVPDSRLLMLGCSSPGGFKVATDGTASPSLITFTAVRFNLAGTANFSASDGAVLTVSGDEATLTYVNMPSGSVTVTVTITDVDGETHERSITISKVFDAGSRFTWIQYADDAVGTGISNDPTGKEYIGFAYNKETQVESNDPSLYAWSLIKGSDGVPGVKGADGITYYTWIKYADQPDGTGLYDTPNDNTLYIGIAVNRTTATESTIKGDYVWSRFRGAQGVQGPIGNTGATGPRGTVQIAVATTGVAWSDAEANAGLVAKGYGAPKVMDMVTLYNTAAKFAQTRTFDGSAWITIAAHINGNMLVDGTVLARHIVTDGIVVRDLQGNPIIGMGVPLPPAYAAPGTLNSDFSNGTLNIGGDNLTPNSSFEKAVNHLATGYSIYNNGGSAEPTTAGTGTGRNGSGRSQIIAWTGNHIDTKGIYGTMCKGGWIPGKTYIISFYAKTTSLATIGGMTNEWNVYPAALAWLLNPNLSTEWQRYAVRITMGATVESGGVSFLSVHTGAGAGNVHLDDLMVTEGEVLTAYKPSTAEAQTQADLAMSRVDDIMADGILSRDEKPGVVTDWYACDVEKASLVPRAADLGVPSAAYAGAHQSLSDYLVTLNPGWSDTTQNTVIDRGVWRAQWTKYYEEKQKLIDAMSAKAATAPSLKLGGRNLYLKTSPFVASGIPATSQLAARLPTGFQLFGVVENTGVMRLQNVIKKNGIYTISFDLHVGLSNGYPMEVDICDSAVQTIDPTTTPQHFELTFTVTNWSDATYHFVDFGRLSGQHYFFNNFKLEEGNKATAYTPAPEDVDANIAVAGTTANWTGVGGRPTDNAIYNDRISMQPDGRLLDSGIWRGQVQSLPTIDQGNGSHFGARNRNDPPVDYAVGTTKQFKETSILTSSDGLAPSGAEYYGVLETIKQYTDASGGGVHQYFYSGTKTFRRYTANPQSAGGGSIWSPWVLDLDRNSYTGDLNATRGAPTGTYVGNTLAETLVSDVGTANSNASSALTTAGQKLSKAGYDAITGQISLQAAYALLVGTSNDGIYYGSNGLVGRKGGYTTFSIASDGTAIFSGNLVAAGGTLGSLHIAAGGGIHGGAFTSYAWPAAGSLGFYIGPEGFKVGSGNRYFNADQFGDVYAPDFTIINGVATFSGKLGGVMSLSISNGIATSKANTTAEVYCGQATVNISGGRAPFKYQWAVSYITVDPEAMKGTIRLANSDLATVDVYASASSNTAVIAGYNVTVIDADGKSAAASTFRHIQFGTPS